MSLSDMRCERCGARPKPARDDAPPALFDYCATCSKNLCPTCMQAGCCGQVPAASGEEESANMPACPKCLRSIGHSPTCEDKPQRKSVATAKPKRKP